MIFNKTNKIIKKRFNEIVLKDKEFIKAISLNGNVDSINDMRNLLFTYEGWNLRKFQEEQTEIKQ